MPNPKDYFDQKEDERKLIEGERFFRPGEIDPVADVRPQYVKIAMGTAMDRFAQRRKPGMYGAARRWLGLD